MEYMLTASFGEFFWVYASLVSFVTLEGVFIKLDA